MSKRAAAAEILERFVKGGVGDWDFDDFISICHSDPALEDARIEVLEIANAYPPDEPNTFVSRAGLDKILEIARRLRVGSL